MQKAASQKPPAARVLDLSGMPLTRYSAEALADVLAAEWGLTKLVLDGCDLAEEVRSSEIWRSVEAVC
jgi:hypothetical protein